MQPRPEANTPRASGPRCTSRSSCSLDLAQIPLWIANDPGYAAHGSPTADGLYLQAGSTGSGMVPSLLGDEPGAQSSAMRNRWIRAGLISVLPRSWKPACYRAMLGYQVGHRVRIGVSLIAVDHCTIADDVEIGHGNVFTRVRRLSLGDHVRIGHLNIFRGGDEVVLDSYSEFLRLNEINSIPDPLVVNRYDTSAARGTGNDRDRWATRSISPMRSGWAGESSWGAGTHRSGRTTDSARLP